MKDNYPLASSTWGKEEIDAIQRVIEKDRYTMGEEVRRFETSFSNYIGSKHSVMVNSGSSANLLMIAALFYVKRPELKLAPGDEVIVPAVSWSTTYYPLYQYGLKIKFVDVDLFTLNYDIDQLKDAITNKTKAIIAVNLLGNPNDFDSISKLIFNKNIILLEDNCESLGSEYKGRKSGSIGKLGTFSFFFSHHISTMEGGMVVTNDDELYQILLSLRAHGWTRDLPQNNLLVEKKSEDHLKESFRFILPGYNLRPLEMSGAIGLEQLKKLPGMIYERRLNANKFVKLMNSNAKIIIQKEIGKSSWFGFSLIVKPGTSLTRDSLYCKLRNEGFECRPIVAGNFVQSEVVKYMNYSIHGDLKNAQTIEERGLFIGNHHYPIDNAIDKISNIIN